MSDLILVFAENFHTFDILLSLRSIPSLELI